MDHHRYADDPLKRAWKPVNDYVYIFHFWFAVGWKKKGSQPGSHGAGELMSMQGLHKIVWLFLLSDSQNDYGNAYDGHMLIDRKSI